MSDEITSIPLEPNVQVLDRPAQFAPRTMPDFRNVPPPTILNPTATRTEAFNFGPDVATSPSPAVRGLRMRQQGYKGFAAEGEERISPSSQQGSMSNVATNIPGTALSTIGTGMMTGFAGAVVGGISSLIGSLVNADVQYDSNAINKELGEGQLQLQNQSLNLQKDMWNREWNAARGAGFLSPSAMGGASFYRNNGTGGAAFQRASYATRNSPYA